LLPVFISAAVCVLGQRDSRLGRQSFAFFLLINLVMFIMNIAGLRDVWYLWNVPVWLIAYILIERRSAGASLKESLPISP
jgi:hypothetical protein